MHDFEYCAPDSLHAAVQLLSSYSGTVNLLAGGTDLTVAMRIGRKRPSLVVDVKRIPELTQIHANEVGLTLGAAVSCRRVYRNQNVVAAFPALIDSTSLIGGIQIQGRATVGGNLCNAAPSADTVPTLIAYGATALVASSNGTRRVAVEDICIAPGQTSLSPKEVLAHLTIPFPPKHSGAMFLRFIPRNEMDIAVVNVATFVELDSTFEIFRSVRIAIGSVAPIPLFVAKAGETLIGKSVNDETIAEAARIARDTATPITDMRGTIEHRRQLIKVLVTRALNGAVRRAKGAVA